VFKVDKAAQIAAYLIWKAGGAMAYLKLIKLMYIADRTSLERLGRSMTGDVPYSLPQGPVLSETLDLMRGQKKSDIWDKWIAPFGEYDLSLNVVIEHPYNPYQFGRLCKAFVMILDEIHEKYKDKDKWEVRDVSHTFPEWEDPKNSGVNRQKILLSTILEKNGMDPVLVDMTLKRVEEEDALERVLAIP